MKTKCIRRQEFVIVGWTPSDKQRGFRSLLLGVNEDGKLRYAGKVGTLADYYEAVAPIMLLWAGSRPISLVRCPQGRAKKCFFQKDDAASFGDEVKHVAIQEKDGHSEPYLFVNTPAGLMTCVQMGTIEFHGWGARIEHIEKADRLVFDLDPDEGLEFRDVVSAALHIQEVLAQIGLTTFPMVTGGKGVHVIAPLTPSAEWPEVKDFAHRLAMALAQSEPERFTAALSKAKRTGRILSIICETSAAPPRLCRTACGPVSLRRLPSR